ncbi:MAG: EAL domain-containing protein [Defluviitaleaceae bacterium]|nr:EAL domain-containing protein [Defluviitaleaceae bacterium]
MDRSCAQGSVLRRIFEFSPEAAVMLDGERHITWTNAAFNELMKYPEGNLEGECISKLYCDEHTPSFYDSIWETAASDELYRGTVWWMGAQGGHIPAVITVAPVMNADSEITAYAITFSHAPNTLRLSEGGHDPRKDELTGLLTKDSFETLIEHKLIDYRKNGGECAVMMFDIDRLNAINDMYGVESTNMLLRQVAARFVKCLPEGSSVARGDDEFWALIEDHNVLKSMSAFAGELLETMDKPFYVSEIEIDFCISASIVFYGDDCSMTKEAIFENLIRTLHIPKQNWQSSYHIYKSKSSLAAQAIQKEELREAITRNEFLLYYQPKIDANMHRLVGLEALVRWQKPGRGMVPPGEFIPVVEASGLMPMLGENIFKMVCAQIQEWDKKGLNDFKVAVNISSMQFTDKSLSGKLIASMTEYDVDPNRIELELRENFASGNGETTLCIMTSLADAGVRFSLDDFGTTCPSINLLKEYPISSLKIDRFFTKSLPDNKDSRDMVVAMTSLAHGLDLKVVAEGVETMAQLEYIESIGCDEMQGYFIAQPLPVDDIEELIRSYQNAE